MFYEQNESYIQRGLDYSIETGYHQIRILTFLKNKLPEFSRNFKAPVKILKQDVDIEFENYISQELQFFLNNNVIQSDYLFGFQAIGPDILVRQFGVGVHGLALLFIEAKRLRSKSSNDYVRSGIKRFKTETHGKQHNIAVMLGYVQEKDFNHWYGKVNSWIIALISDKSENPKWSKGEQVNEIRITDIGEYQSTHCRITKKPITLHHFWIDLCDHAPKMILN